ncbi:MAG: hypothetical protein IIZ78_06415 [Clostridiales bacterium]|nr:hypothetical protein [Clostridiales bacterium]
MANMLEKLRAKRENGEITTSSTGVKVAGEGHFTVKLTEAKWDKNRTGDAEQGKLSFKVVAVRKDTDPSEVGSVFSEYVSLKNEEMAQKKYLQISDWLSAAGVADSKMVDDDDETFADSMRTLILAADKFAKKRDVTANCYRKASDKVDSNGRPYYNNYFNDPNSDEEDYVEDKKKETSAASEKKSEKPAESPYKKTDKKVDEEDED